MRNRLTILGSGDTLGTPVPGCKRPACLDDDPKSRRYRFGLLVEVEGATILVDPNPDIKWQFLDNNIHFKDIDHILVTHQHSDHVNGLGEFFYRRKDPTKLWYGHHPLNEKLIDYWRYIEREGVMQFNTYTNFKEFSLYDKVSILPIELNHGFPASGFVVSAAGKKIAVVTDSNADLSEQTLQALQDVDYLFIDTFSENMDQVKGVYEDCNIPIPDLNNEWFHMTIEESKKISQQVNAKQTYTVHMSRHMSPHQQLVDAYQTDNFIIGYDGLEVKF